MMILIMFINVANAMHMGSASASMSEISDRQITPQETTELFFGTGDVPDDSVDWSKIKIDGDRAPWVAGLTSPRPSLDNVQASHTFYDQAVSKAKTF
jgi:hypothetical protein